MPPDQSAALSAHQEELFVPAPEIDRKRKLLVIDDDALFSRVLCRMLARSGYTVVRALRLEQIVSLARGHRLDAILLDARLGAVDGLTVCRGLRRHAATKDVPVLMMTGYSCPDEKQVEAARLGVGEFLFKPFSTEELTAALERALAHDAPAKSAEAGGRILVVDDDPSWPEILIHWLDGDGHVTRVVSDPRRLLEEARRFRPDCVVLDYMLGGAPADALCARLRAEPALEGAQLIVHSGHAQAKVTMLDAGADQFVFKSGAADELLAVVRACLRRARGRGRLSSDGGVILDATTRSLCWKGKAVTLSPRLFGLLRLLVEARGTVSRQHILERLPDAAEERDHEVDVLVSRLRAVLKKTFGSEPAVETVCGAGYRWIPPSKSSSR